MSLLFTTMIEGFSPDVSHVTNVNNMIESLSPDLSHNAVKSLVSPPGLGSVFGPVTDCYGSEFAYCSSNCEATPAD